MSKWRRRRLLRLFEESEDVSIWLRWFGMVQRGSSRVYLQQLPDREVAGQGQGGGGPLSCVELENVLRAHTDTPALAAESILHTDSAKAYKRVGPLKYARRGAHLYAFEGTPPFDKFHYLHTNVCHKKKVGVRQEFVALRTVRSRSGRTRDVLGGTQKIDGFWASLRRFIGRKACNTGTADSVKREWLHANVRCFQWHWWNLHLDRFEQFGKLLANRRDEADWF